MKIRENVPDILMTVGAGLLSYGASLVYFPAGFMVGGSLVIYVGWLAAKKN